MSVLGFSVLLIVFLILLLMGRPEKRKRPKKERRITPRHKASLRVRYKLPPEEEGISWIGDISRGGARIFLNKDLRKLKIGESLEIEIHSPSKADPLLVKGNIVWLKESNAGVQFDEMIQSNIEKIIHRADK